ncbi:hypothetical protein [Rhodoferax sp. UBA5149]|uniref:hypothetical protein n=1 Tax=Rhodoferax sp. UBA5149 TaxID=1947379 RepID=UPI0025E7661C|nr:hypothetical protein [Rhodoferax sp. UBA5149]
MNAELKRHHRSQIAVGAWAVAFAVLTLSPAALAQRERRTVRPQWHGDIARFHEHDWGVWRGGRWAHSRHDGRLGWWWVVGASWYFYPAPVYPYPNPWEPPPVVLVTPPVGVVPPAPPTQYWYYCEASRAYYPYVPTCPGGWQQVLATPSDGSPIPSK